MLDLNDAAPQRDNDPIPPCITKLHAKIRPGDQNGPGPEDLNVLTASKSSNALMLNFEFTVVAGPHANRKFFQNMVVSGGKVDANGISKGWNITKSTLRALLESAFGISPKDESADARAKRSPPGFISFDGLEFVGKIGLEKGAMKDTNNPDAGSYQDKNVLDLIITPDMKEYAGAMNGETLPVAAKAASGGGAGASAAKAPSWGAPVPPGAAAATTKAKVAETAGAAKGPTWLNS